MEVEFNEAQAIFTLDVGTDPSSYTTKGAGVETKVDIRLKYSGAVGSTGLFLYTLVQQQNFYTLSSEGSPVNNVITPEFGSQGFTP